MKYIIFQHKSYLIHPVIFGEHTSHAQVKLEGCKPINAGFYRIEGGYPVVYGRSDSLNLEPNPDMDPVYIHRLLCGCGTSMFIPLEHF